MQDHAITGDGRQQTSKLILVAALLQSGDDFAQPGLEGGIIGELSFRIDEEADATVFLDASAKMTEVGSYAVVSSPKLQTRDGTVYVLAPGNMPGIGCFFFTH